jgi:hypothetical protein
MSGGVVVVDVKRTWGTVVTERGED